MTETETLILASIRTLSDKQDAILAAQTEVLRLLRIAVEREHPVPDMVLAALPHAIARAIGARVFTTRSLVREHARIDADLHSALVAVLGPSLSTKSLAHKLRPIEGKIFDGLSLHRVEGKETSHGVNWMVVAV